MLKRVSIQNFKSLKDVTLNLQKINLLIGPNNSGKTNFLKSFAFLKEVLSSKEVDGLDSFVYNKKKEDIIMRLVFDNEFIEAFSGKFEHNIVARTYYEEDGGAFYKRDKPVLSTSVAFSDVIDGYTEGEIAHEIETIDFDSIKYYTGDIKIYKTDSGKISKPSPVGDENSSVDSDASNIINFLDLMLGKYRKTILSKIEQDMERCVPEFDEINLDNVTPTQEMRKLYGEGKVFKRLGLTNNKQGITYWADELSEGTLYFLALLCIINQPEPPKLLLLEEPEKGIHPRRIREVIDLIFKLIEEKDIQIILTTHNEHVLDEFATRPESVFVFDKDEEGATYVRNLQTDIIEPTNKRNEELGLDPIDLTSNLSENWLYGLLGGVPPMAE